MFINTWNPILEKNIIYEKHVGQNLTKVEQLRYLLELDAYEQEKGRLLGNFDMDNDLWNI